MNVQFWNTLGRKMEVFEPQEEGKVGMYVCGPTVYREISIGNCRAYIFADVLRRTLQANGYEVKHVMNITDVGHLTDDASEGEDKLEKEARERGLNAWEIAKMYTDLFFADMKRLHVLEPHVVSRATDHIEEQIKMIQDIEAAGYAYRTSDGIYFDTSKLSDYGKLTGQAQEEKEAGARVEVNEEKRHPADFALWKFSQPEESRQMEWESPWGVGFPGWHIECSAMSEKYLGSPFDIHTGGIDHIPVHHTNEIAQTEAARGNSLARYWLHNEFLLVNGGKMSKSLKNTYTVSQLIEKGFDPIAYRYFTLGAHYRSPLNFTWEALKGAQNALINIRMAAQDLNKPSAPDTELVDRFMEKVNNDLDTPGALAVFWETLNDQHLESGVKAATLLKFDEIFGLGLGEIIGRDIEVPLRVLTMIEERERARKEKRYEDADMLRGQIEEAGFEVKDTAEGVKVYKRI